MADKRAETPTPTNEIYLKGHSVVEAVVDDGVDGAGEHREHTEHNVHDSSVPLAVSPSLL